MKLSSKIILITFLIIGQFSCNSITQEFENRSKSCNLKLYENEKYSYKFPKFLSETLEKGIYIIQDSNLVLTRKELNTFPESELGPVTWLYENPSKLKIEFRNLNNEAIDVKLSINGSNEELSTRSGEHEISYEELERKNIIPSGGQVRNLKIIYNKEDYFVGSINLKDSRRPTHLDIILNEFKNKKHAYFRRHYVVSKDQIYMKDINKKNIGTNNAYLIRKYNY